MQTAAPAIAGLLGSQTAFQHQFAQLNQCFTKVFYPAIKTELQDGSNTSGVEVYKEFWYTMAGLAGLGQNFDGNGAGGRFAAGQRQRGPLAAGFGREAGCGARAPNR